jgi:hypothetical protein
LTHATSPSHRSPDGPVQATRSLVKGRTTQYSVWHLMVSSSGNLGKGESGATETPSIETRGVLAEVNTLPKICERSSALVLISQDCGPTCSDSGNAEVVQDVLRTRMLLSIFQGGRQARLHALPVNAQLAPGRE